MSVIYAINAGSSSIRLAAFSVRPLAPLMTRRHELTGGPAENDVSGWLRKFDAPAPTIAVHRIVHGGHRLTAPCFIDTEIENEIEALTPLATLHQPAALAGVRAVRNTFGSALPQVAVFDTSFYSDMPLVAQTYALPAELREQHQIRRFGFHGIAHQAMLESLRTGDSASTRYSRVISLQLGAGCSVTASRDGRPVDTSMGFSPLEGLVMGTRSGDVDPGALLHLLIHNGMEPAALLDTLSRRSGLLGLSSSSPNVSDLLARTDAAARLAIDVYCHRIVRYLGAFLAVLGGLDAIVFGGGVGENVPEIRARVLSPLKFAGVRLHAAANARCRGAPGLISEPDSQVAVWVQPVDEARIMALAACELLGE